MEGGREGGGRLGDLLKGSHLVFNCVLQGLVVGHETLFISKLAREEEESMR